MQLPVVTAVLCVTELSEVYTFHNLGIVLMNHTLMQKEHEVTHMKRADIRLSKTPLSIVPECL